VYKWTVFIYKRLLTMKEKYTLWKEYNRSENTKGEDRNNVEKDVK
jgi:hypothetical protein